MKMPALKMSLVVLPFLASCSVDFKKIEHKAALINHYETVSLKLAKENRELRAEVKRLEFKIEKMKTESGDFRTPASHDGHEQDSKHEKVDTHASNADHGAHAERSIASVAPVESKLKKDYVEFKTYKWHADDLIKIADKEFKEKHFEKAAQFYSSLLKNYPSYKHFNDEFYFKAGIAAYESGEHHDWTIDHFEALMHKYPTSKYYRSAKLWVALTHMKMGEKKKFFETVEEFRKKYRNTQEWKILSAYYEKIEEKTHE